MATAQVSNFQARVTRVTSGVTYYRGSLPSALRLGEILQPRDVIDTGRSGRVVIALDDGSQVTIFPGSRVELKDFQGGGSWRDLLDVTVGRVRATINHRVKRPNPYRVYSPVASIAVRGTDFLVIVEPNGETRVVVYEGLVEVGSLLKPQQPILVRPGRNIIVRPDGDISLVTAAPRGELNEIRSIQVGNSLSYNLYTAYDTHQESFTDIQASRFTAFADSHLDSFQNPAYAGEFRHPNGRLYLVPSYSPEIETLYRYDREIREDRLVGISSSNYTLSSQLSYFTPIGAKTVLGGGVVVTKTDLGGAETEGPYSTQELQNRIKHDRELGILLPPDPPGGQHLPEDGSFTLHNVGKAKFTTADMALMIARRLGQTERTNIGVKFDYIEDRSSYSTDANWSTKTDSTQEKYVRPGRRLGFTTGLTHNFGEDKKLGVYYRYSAGAFPSRFHHTQQYTSIELKTFFSTDSDWDFSDSRATRFSEVGARFRGSVTRRLFYGLEGSLRDERRRLEYRNVFIPETGESGTATVHTRTRSAKLGGGLGYALRRRTALGIDLSAGGALENQWSEHRDPPGVESSDTFSNERSTFWALHFGGQTDLWWNLYIGGSRLLLRDGVRSNSRSVFRSVFGGEPFFYDQFSLEKKSKLSNLSLGWRMTPSWIVQYTYFTSHGPNAPSHSLMLRYEFGETRER